MSHDRLGRIENKLDTLVSTVADLRSTTVDLTLGQAGLELGFQSLSARLVGGSTVPERTEREWQRLDEVITELRGVGVLRTQVERGFADVIRHVEHRIEPLEDTSRKVVARLDSHEQRLAALEQRRHDQLS